MTTSPGGLVGGAVAAGRGGRPCARGGCRSRTRSPRSAAAAPADDDARARVDGEAAVGGLDDVAVDEVHVADEVGHEGRQRPVVDRARLVELLDQPVRHDRHPVRHRERLLLVVGHVDERDPDLKLDALELDLHLLAELQVERAERLVEQEHARVHDERPRQGDALLLAAREHRRAVLVAAGELDELERLARALLALALSDLALLQAVGDVVEDRHVREERVLLEDGVHVALVGRRARDVAAADQDLALVGLLEAGDHPQRRRLAAAARPEQRQELALVDAQVDRVHRDERAEPLRDRAELDIGFAGFRGCGAGLRCRRGGAHGGKAFTRRLPAYIVCGGHVNFGYRI